MWRNKHVVTALLVAPVLALVAYFGVDAAVTEPAAPAEPGKDYALAVGSSCRYESGVCELKNGDVVLALRATTGGGWQIDAGLALDGAVLSAGDSAGPTSMSAMDSSGRRWTTLAANDRAEMPATLRLVVALAGSRYYAEVPTTFAR